MLTWKSMPGYARCCTEREKPTTVERRKARPLLTDLDDAFREHAGEDGKLDAEQLEQVLIAGAERKCGYLTEEERDVVARSAQLYLNAMDKDSDNKVSYAEFITFMLNEHSDLRHMRSELKSSMELDPSLLPEVIDLFRKWDHNGDGFVTAQDLSAFLDVLSDLPNREPEQCCRFCPCRRRRKFSDARKRRAESLLKELEKDTMGKFDLWEVVAVVLGRRKTPVELLLYDISGGISAYFSPVLLGKHFEAIYHTSVLAYGKECWWGGPQIFLTKPPATAQFGPPLRNLSKIKLGQSAYGSKDLRVVHLGWTLATQGEFESFLVRVMSRKFTEQSYDVLTHNCIHFANEVVHFLTGSSIPEEVLSLPEQVMNAPGARLMRPFLNRWLGGFRTKEGAVETLVRSAEVVESTDAQTVCREVLGRGVLVTVPSTGRDRQVGSVTRISPSGDVATVRCFDPSAGEFTERTVPKAELRLA